MVQIASVSTAGRSNIINLVNPGSVDIGLQRDGNKFIQSFDRVIGRTAGEGGRLLIDAAVAKGEDAHGKCLSEAKVTKYGKFPEHQEYEINIRLTC